MKKIHFWKCELGHEFSVRKKGKPKLCGTCHRKLAMTYLRDENSPKKPRTDKQKLEAKADLDWGLAVRKRDKICRLCKNEPSSNAHHVIKRGNKITRFILKNGIGLSFNCHTYVESLYTKDWSSPFPSETSEYKDCMIKIIGQELWDELHAILKTKKFKYTPEFILDNHAVIKNFLITHEEN